MYKWVLTTVKAIEEGKMKIKDACQNVEMIDSIEPKSISISTFYKCLQMYNIKINRNRGRYPHPEKDLEIIQIITILRNSGIIVGVKKMYEIIRKKYPQVSITWHRIRNIYAQYDWLQLPPKRKPQPPQRCRYQAVYPNQIWHIDIHIWSRHNGLYIFGVIDDRSRFVIGLSILTQKNSTATSKELEKMFIQYGVPGAIWSDNGGENIGKKMIDLLNKYNVRLIRTTPYNPEQNGKIERLWQSLERMTNQNYDSIEIFRNNYNNIIPHTSLYLKYQSNYILNTSIILIMIYM